MLSVNLPVAETIHAQSNKFVMGVKIKATEESKINESPANMFGNHLCLTKLNQQENVTETADATPTPQVKVAETQEANDDSQGPPSGDAVAEEVPSQPADEPSQEGEGGEVPTGDVERDKANQLQVGGDGGENVDSVDDVDQPQEGQEQVELEVSQDTHCVAVVLVRTEGMLNIVSTGTSPGVLTKFPQVQEVWNMKGREVSQS